MKRRLIILTGLVLALAAAGPARAADPPAVELRRWYLGLQVHGGERDRWDVYGRDGLPPAAVEDRGRGGGFLFGYRFGGRFLLGLQLVLGGHDLVDRPERMYDTEALVTGTVLWRERRTLQPFVRGGFGVAGAVLEQPDGDGQTAAVGTAAIAGGGLQVRLSSRFSLEWELAARFTNFYEVQENRDSVPDSDWRVDTSHLGWRSGLGVMVWF